MKIGMVKRLRLTYAFWKALGVKNCNSVFAAVHESGFGDLAAGNLSDEALEDMRKEKDSARGYDHEHKTT